MKVSKVVVGSVVGLAVLFSTVSIGMADIIGDIREAVRKRAETVREEKGIKPPPPGGHSDAALDSLPAAAENVEDLGGGWVRFSLDDKDFLFYRTGRYQDYTHAALTQILYVE